MMKKILLIFITIFAISGISAFNLADYIDGNGNYDLAAAKVAIEADPNLEMTILIPELLNGDIIENINFAGLIPVLDATMTTTITDTLTAEGYDATVIDSVLSVVEDLGNGFTIEDIRISNPDFASVENAIVSAMATQVTDELVTPEMQTQLNDSLDLAGSVIGVLNGFAQSTANTAVASSLFGYQGYKLFIASVGFLGSFAFPEPMDTAQSLYDISQNLDTGEDLTTALTDYLDVNGVEAGITFQGVSANIGINLSRFVDRLYLSAVFGSTSATVSSLNDIGTAKVDILGSSIIDSTLDNLPIVGSVEIPADIPALELTLGSSVFGLRVNYQLVKGFGIPILFRWNGLSLGTGFIVNSMNIEGQMDLSSILELEADTLGAEFSILSDTYTIPLEASTGIQLLSILSVNVGGGADIQFGSSSIDFDMITSGGDSIGTKVIRETIDEILSTSDAISFPYAAEGEVRLINPRVNASVGVGLGPIILDLSAYYYFRTGVAFGLNAIIRI